MRPVPRIPFACIRRGIEPRGKYLPLYWIALSAGVVGVDYMTGPTIQFPIASTVPIILASWYSGRTWGFGLAVALANARFVFGAEWTEPLPAIVVVVNGIIRSAVFVGIAFLVSHSAKLTRDIRVLKGIIPICSNCKKIRDENDVWKPMEIYISEHTDADFSHGLCSRCAEMLYPKYFRKSD